MDKVLEEKLLAAATAVRENAYAPYSQFLVGAALLGKSGKIYTGCNMENQAYPVGLCAEQAAFAKAISEGEKNIIAIAVVTASSNGSPCGKCRQTMAEFCSAEVPVILSDLNKSIRQFSVGELLPHAFFFKEHP